MSKECPVCKIVKPLSEYHKRSDRKSGVQSKCIPCLSEYKKNRYWSNREVELEKMTKSRLKPENIKQRKSYYEKNADQYKARYEKYKLDDHAQQRKKEVNAERYKRNMAVIKERHKANYQKTKDKIREKHNKRKLTDPEYVLKRRLRSRLKNIINDLGSKRYKIKSALSLLGCGLLEFKKHIESKFFEGMSWDRLSEIHIDHIKPCAAFDLTNIDEQKKCFHYTNLQPLWIEENLSKGAIYPYKKPTHV